MKLRVSRLEGECTRTNRRITSYEVMAPGVCLGILVLVGVVVYFVYRSTVKTIRRQLAAFSS